MVVFDNLAKILRETLAKSTLADNLKEWKLLGQERNGQLMVGWIEENLKEKQERVYTYLGLYRPKTNYLKVLSKLNGIKNIIQATVNADHSLVSYVEKVKSDEVTEGSDLYQHHVAFVNDTPGHITTCWQSFEKEQRQIMTAFVGKMPNEISRLLVFIHLQCIRMLQVKKDQSQKLITIKCDAVTKSFTWAQWDCENQSLFFIHFRKIPRVVEDEESGNQEASPTLSCLQFHEDLPHETVLNIPLNLPSFSLPTNSSCLVYEDDPLPLRIHDCSLDLIVVSDPSGVICICHHYLYQPEKPTDEGIQNGKLTVHFAYSVTLLHHGCVIHSVVPGVPWNSAKIVRPVFELLGGQYLVVYANDIFTHLLDVGLLHQPSCHILMNGTLPAVPRNASRLVSVKKHFLETDSSEINGNVLLSVVIDLQTMDLIEFEITVEDLLNCLIAVESIPNRLSILHYFLVHAADFECLEEALKILLQNPTDINVPKILQEVLIGGAYSFAQKNLSADANPLLKLLPISCIDSGHIETKLNQHSCTTKQEILWNTAMMLLSPQQRLIPFNTDIWKKLWDQLIKLGKSPRFKPSQAADKVLVSLGYYQPEALTCCNTPVSPGNGLVSRPVDVVHVNQGLTYSRKGTGIDLPFHEFESCTASKQEHIISVNLRELTLHFLKNCLREPPIHIHLVATRYVAAQLEISKLLCHLLGKIAGIEEETKREKGFPLIKNLHQKQRILLFAYYQRYYNAVDTLAYPLPSGFTSFFSYLGFTSMNFQYFMMYLHNNVLELQTDVMKEIMKDIEDTDEGVKNKLRLLLLLPRSRAKRILYGWSHGASLTIRAREHALNILSGVQNSHCQGIPHPRRIADNSRGLAAFPSADRLSPLDTFLDLLTAKASLTDLDFNLLIDATISSTQDLKL